ncbi:hypothetical protein KAR91_10125 [Candidatus Pacearchaeota archaeon]|nr:hypothetical protein [Candidatus Pacearchaeota archaeon]
MSNIKGIDELKADDGATPNWDGRAVETEASDHDKIRFENGDIDLERMADVVHQVWCVWMEYMFKQGHVSSFKEFVISPEPHGRWRRQMITPYAQLSEGEKQSDRDIARRYLNIAWSPENELADIREEIKEIRGV